MGHERSEKEEEEREKRRKKIAAEDDERELKREEAKLKKRGLKGIPLRQEMMKVNERIVKDRLRKDRERMDRLMREMNDWPRRMSRREREVDIRRERQEKREKEEAEERERKERKERREKEEKERKERKEKREKEEKEREERKEKERQERKEKKDKESEMEVQQWIDTSGLSTSKLASRLGKILTEEDDSVASSPKAIGDDDAEMEDVEKGLRQDALSSTLKAGTSRQPSAALTKDVASTGTDSQPDFGSFVATPGASSYDSGRDDVDDDSEDRRSRQRTKSGGEAHTSRNLEVVRNLMTEFLDASDRRREAGEPE